MIGLSSSIHCARFALCLDRPREERKDKDAGGGTWTAVPNDEAGWGWHVSGTYASGQYVASACSWLALSCLGLPHLVSQPGTLHHPQQDGGPVAAGFEF